MAAVKTAISLDPEIADFTADFAKRHKLSRSAVVAMALKRLRQAERSGELSARIRAAYAKHDLSDEDRAWLETGSKTAWDQIKADRW